MHCIDWLIVKVGGQRAGQVAYIAWIQDQFF